MVGVTVVVVVVVVEPFSASSSSCKLDFCTAKTIVDVVKATRATPKHIATNLAVIIIVASVLTIPVGIPLKLLLTSIRTTSTYGCLAVTVSCCESNSVYTQAYVRKHVCRYLPTIEFYQDSEFNLITAFI